MIKVAILKKINIPRKNKFDDWRNFEIDNSSGNNKI